MDDQSSSESNQPQRPSTPSGDFERRLSAVEQGLSRRPQTVSFVFNVIMAVATIAAALYTRSATKSAEEQSRLTAKSSEKQFIQINRPLLLLTPVRFQSGEFLSVVANGREITYRNQYEVKNVGNVIAKNIELGRVRATDAQSGKRLPIQAELPTGKFSLGPGEQQIMVSELSLSLTTAEAATNYAKAYNDSMEVRMLVSYSHALDAGRAFKTMRRDRIGKNFVVTLDSDFSDVLPSN